MDELKTILELVASIGVLPVLVYLVWRLNIGNQNSQSDEHKRNADFNAQMATIIASQNAMFGKLDERLVKQDEQIDLLGRQFTLLKDTTLKIDQDRKDAIAANMQAILATQQMVRENTEALVRLGSTFDTAHGTAVREINEHASNQFSVVNGHINGVQVALTKQHAEQTGDYGKQMSTLSKKVEENGDATRKLIIEQLRTISERLDALQQRVETRDSQMYQQLHQLSTDVSEVLLLITKPKVEVPVTKPELPAPTDAVKKE